MLVLVVFTMACVSTSNASSTMAWYSQTTKTTTLPPRVPAPSNEYCPLEKLKMCGFKHGTPAAKRQFPYVAFLKCRNDFQVKHCSGSLIHHKWVLTSANCMLPDATVEVILGTILPLNMKDPERVVVESELVFVHPGYLPFYKNPKNDLALIKLSKSVKSAAIIPVALKRDSGPIAVDNITFAAWEEVGFESLAYTKHILVSEGPCQCQDSDNKSNPNDAAVDSDTQTYYCCLSVDFFCFIYNGGGLVIDGVLVAVMSTRCFTHCSHMEGTFTNLYQYRHWIDDTLATDTSPEPTSQTVYTACSDISGSSSGVYLIQPNNDIEPFEVYCELRLDGEKWTVIHQRFNESVDFYRNYANYTNGFGPLNGNHWLGLEKIHQLTKNDDYELNVEVKAHNSTKGYANYRTFKVDSAGNGYKLKISGYSGTAGDSMYDTGNTLCDMNGMMFTTFDKDQDTDSKENNARYYHGGWWYNFCSYSHLNTRYEKKLGNNLGSMRWILHFGSDPLKTARMMIRRK